MTVRCAVLIGVACLVVGCGTGTKDDALQTVRYYDLIKALPKASVKTRRADFVRPASFQISMLPRQVLFMHPDAEAEFPPLNLTASSRLQFGVGVNELAWDKPCDGVQFSVFVKSADGKRTQIYSRFVNPRTVAEDRRWFDADVPLQAFAGKSVHLILSTSAGPAKNAEADWGGWSTPRVLLEVQ